MTMNATRLQSRLMLAARELQREANSWRGETRAKLQRAARQAVEASASVHRATARNLRAAEALHDAALEMVVRHAVTRLDLELEHNA